MAEFLVRLEMLGDDGEPSNEDPTGLGLNRADLVTDAETAEEAVDKASKRLHTNMPVRARVFLLEECRRYHVELRANIAEVQDW